MIQKILFRILFQGKGIFLILLTALTISVGSSLTTIFIGTYLRFESLKKNVRGKKEILILTKEIGIFNTLLNSRVKFSPEDLEKIRSSGLFEDIGEFTPSMFGVEAKLDISMGMKTSLFLESVDPKFLGPVNQEFNWKEGDPYIPLILSSDFIDLYNFGFSMAMGFPQIDPSNIDKIPIVLTLSGKKKTLVRKAKIIGTTHRIQSILAPPSFTNWANQTLAGEDLVSPSRLILIAKDPQDVKTKEFIASNHWKINKDSMGLDRFRVLAKWVLGILTLFCTIFSLVIFFLLLSTIRISILTRREEWRRLVEMGYPVSVFSNSILRVLGLISIASMLITGFITWNVHQLIFKALWDARILWPGDFLTSDFLSLIFFHLLILAITWMILKRDERKIVLD